MDTNASDKYGRTRLHRTIESRSTIEVNDQRAIETLVAEVNTLLDDGANVNTTTNPEGDELTPLHAAASHWRDIPIKLFRRLLEKSTQRSINARNSRGKTVLHLAFAQRSEIISTQLLQHTRPDVDGVQRIVVDVGVKDTAGLTPLDVAARWQDIPPHLFKKILDLAILSPMENALAHATAMNSGSAIRQLQTWIYVLTSIQRQSKSC